MNQKSKALVKNIFIKNYLKIPQIKLNYYTKKNKNKLSKDKQKQMEDTIERLKEIKNSDFSNKILKEMKNKLIELSYNKRDTVLNTWNNPNNKISGKIIMDDELTKKYLEELANCDTGQNQTIKMFDNKYQSESKSESETINKKSKLNILSRRKSKKIIV